MASSTYERPEWIKPNDPLFAMLSYKCINTMVWLIRTLPRRTPTNSAGHVISMLEYFLSMDETNFWMVMDRCPECTSHLLINARDRYWQRKANRLANMVAQEDILEIDMLTKSSSKNRARRSVNRKLPLGRSVDVPTHKLKRSQKIRSNSK